MGIDIKIDGKPKWNVGTYSVAEDSTPIDPNDSSGGYGQFTFDIPESDDALFIRTKTIDLSDGSQGKTQGIARGLTSDGVTVTVAADSRLSALAVTRTAQPFSGTLEAAFRYYLGLVGVTDGIVVDTTISERAVIFPGWSGNGWDQIKKMATAQQVEITLASNNIVLRPLRGRTAINYRDSSESWSIDDTNLAQSVQVYYYQSKQRVAALAYPLGGWKTDTPVQQGLDAGSVTKVNIPLVPSDTSSLGASLVSVEQPVAVNSVAPDYDASSVYTVIGNDSLPIPAAEWVAGGGKVEVEIGDDTQSLNVTITASNDTQYAPYQLAEASGPSNSYSTLRIVGNGIFYDRQMITFQTGNEVDRAPTEIGATVDNSFIQTYEQAFHAGLWTSAAWTGPAQSISVNTSGINRRGDTGSYRYPTMAEFNVDPDFSGKTMGQFNAQFAGWTMKQFSDYELNKVAGDFDNQAFGNIAGARVLHQRQWYRIRSVPGAAPDGLSYTAERDTIMGDFNASYEGMTMAEFNALWTARTNGDFAVAPLKEVA